MIAEEDTNNDGVIDREEFFAMLQKKKHVEWNYLYIIHSKLFKNFPYNPFEIEIEK